MMITQQQLIEKIKNNPFTTKDYSKDVLITIEGIVNLFPEEKKKDILKFLSVSKKIKIDMLTGEIVISKDLFF